MAPRALSIMAGRTIGLSREHHDFNLNSPSRIQNSGIPMPHLLAGALGAMTSQVRLYL